MVSARSRSLTPKAEPYTPRTSRPRVRSHAPNKLDAKYKSTTKTVPKPPLKTVDPKTVRPNTATPKSVPLSVPPSTPSCTPSTPATQPNPKPTAAERRIAAAHRRTPTPEHLFISPPAAAPFHFSMVPPLRVPKSNAMWAREGRVDMGVYLAELEGPNIDGQDESGSRDSVQQGRDDPEVIVISDSDDEPQTISLAPSTTNSPAPSLPRPHAHAHTGADATQPSALRYPSFSPNPGWTPAQTRSLWAAMIEVGEKNKNWATIAASVSRVGPAKSNSECRKKWEREKKRAFA